MSRYIALVNTTTNFVENVTVDDREIYEITVPDGYMALDLATTYAVRGYVDTDGVWVEHPPTLGVGGIGMFWDGEMLYKLPPS